MAQAPREINQVLRDLVAARDEARLRAHLLGMDARQRLADIEREIESFERRLAARGDWVAEHVIATARGLTHALAELLSPASEEQPPRVRDVMSREPRTCSPQDRLNTAAQQMWEHDCGVLPVVDDDGRAVGMLTDRDICMAAYTRGLALSEIAVSSAMSASVCSCKASASLRSVMQLMASHQVRRLPVVDETEKVVGIVSLADIARLTQEPSLMSHEARVWVPGVLAGISERSAAAAARMLS